MVRADALAALPMFRGLSAGELDELAAHLVEGRAAAQERLIREGDAHDHPIYILLAGSVDVIKAGVDRRPNLIGSLSAPSVFGEVEVLARRPAIASVVASTACDLALLSRTIFDELVAANQGAVLKVVKNLATTLAYRLAATDERLAAHFAIGGDVTQEQLGDVRRVIYAGWRPE